MDDDEPPQGQEGTPEDEWSDATTEEPEPWDTSDMELDELGLEIEESKVLALPPSNPQGG